MKVGDDRIWPALPMPAVMLDQGDLIAELNPAAEYFLNAPEKLLQGRQVTAFLRTDIDLAVNLARARADTAPLFLRDVTISLEGDRDITCDLQLAPLGEGQVEGAVVQAAGYALMENLQVRDGRIITPYLSQYLIPGIRDIPARVDAVLVEIPDPIGPWGARGMAEMPFMPLAPAVVAALHDATGMWFDEIPLLPWKVVEGLKAQSAE